MEEILDVVRTSIVVFCAILGEEDDSSDDEFFLPRDKLVKVEGYAEITVPQQTPSQFREHFRLTRTTFEDLLLRMTPILYDENNLQAEPLNGGRPVVEPSKQLLVGPWVLANRESFRSEGDRFGIAKSTAWHCSNRIFLVLLRLNQEQHIIAFPNAARQAAIVEGFAANEGFPGTVGAADGCHIPIPAPHLFHESYMNRKGFHSILLQGTCDHNMLFLDCYVGEVGSLHDSCVLRRSDLYEKIMNRKIEIDVDRHIIADSAFLLSQWMMIPYRNNGHITQEQKNFNKILSKSRQVIERAFGLLKARFRRLHYLDMQRVEMMPLFVMACCILHNICIVDGDWEWLQGDVIDDCEVLGMHRNECEGQVLRDVQVLDQLDGTDKRNAIALQLYRRHH